MNHTRNTYHTPYIIRALCMLTVGAALIVLGSDWRGVANEQWKAEARYTGLWLNTFHAFFYTMIVVGTILMCIVVVQTSNLYIQYRKSLPKAEDRYPRKHSI